MSCQLNAAAHVATRLAWATRARDTVTTVSWFIPAFPGIPVPLHTSRVGCYRILSWESLSDMGLTLSFSLPAPFGPVLGYPSSHQPHHMSPLVPSAGRSVLLTPAGCYYRCMAFCCKSYLSNQRGHHFPLLQQNSTVTCLLQMLYAMMQHVFFWRHIMPGLSDSQTLL